MLGINKRTANKRKADWVIINPTYHSLPALTTTLGSQPLRASANHNSRKPLKASARNICMCSSC